MSWPFSSFDSCIEALGDRAYGNESDTDTLYCNGTWDTILCWPATPAGQIVQLPCPDFARALDTSKFGYRRCGLDGQWEGRHAPSTIVTNSNDNTSVFVTVASTPLAGKGSTVATGGWTNYTDCYRPESLWMFERLFTKIPTLILPVSMCLQQMKEIAYGTRALETVGLTLSLFTLCISIFIFCHFQNLRCDRTRMHRHLFVALSAHVAILLTVHFDQFIAQSIGRKVAGASIAHVAPGTIYSTPVICECLQALIEYTKTVTFMWMFIEGFYLHNLLVVTVFPSTPNYSVYCLVGWGFPVLLTVTWTIINIIVNKQRCWFLYHIQSQYWVLEGPRTAVICVNLIFLLNIVRQLIRKLRQNNSSEVLQAWKATRAALFLLPLLGAANFLTMVEPPTDSLWKFAVWSYATHFVIAFQGFFMSLLHCFLNAEVQHTLCRRWSRMTHSTIDTRARSSRYSTNVPFRNRCDVNTTPASVALIAIGPLVTSS